MTHKKLHITERGKGIDANVRAVLHEQHFHSGITQPDRHRGIDRERLQYRKAVYESAKHQRPQRWSSRTQNWEAISSVSLNMVKVH